MSYRYRSRHRSQFLFPSGDGPRLEIDLRLAERDWPVLVTSR
jgi:hypothetical protein